MRIASRFLGTCFIVLVLAASALAQRPAASLVRDRQLVLRPPAGAKVAIVVFEDLECPDCARAHPIIQSVAAAQKVPVVRHDFPLPKHTYAFDAAVIGRYFDSKSPKLGAGWREYVFENQSAFTAQNLTEHAQRFAQANGTAMPFLLDPGGKFAARVRADFALGQKIGIQHTPTIWVVGATKAAHAAPFVEVVDRAQMSQMIDDMRKAAGGK